MAFPDERQLGFAAPAARPGGGGASGWHGRDESDDAGVLQIGRRFMVRLGAVAPEGRQRATQGVMATQLRDLRRHYPHYDDWHREQEGMAADPSHDAIYGGRSRGVFGALTYPHLIVPYLAYYGHLASYYGGPWCSPIRCW